MPVPYIFANKGGDTVPAAQIDANFAYVLTAAGQNYKGPWDEEFLYFAGMSTNYDGSLFIAQADVTGTPPGDPDAPNPPWLLIIKRGVQGEQGPPGITGSVGPIGPQGPIGDTLNPRGNWLIGTGYVAADEVNYNDATYYIPVGYVGTVTGVIPPAAPWVLSLASMAAADAEAAAITATAAAAVSREAAYYALMNADWDVCIIQCANTGIEPISFNALEGKLVEGIVIATGNDTGVQALIDDSGGGYYEQMQSRAFVVIVDDVTIGGLTYSPMVVSADGGLIMATTSTGQIWGDAQYNAVSPIIDTTDNYFFVNRTSEQYNIYKLSKTTGSGEFVTTAGNNLAPTLSADGGTLFFQTDRRDNIWQTWCVPVAGGDEVPFFAVLPMPFYGDSLSFQGMPNNFATLSGIEVIIRAVSGQDIEQCFCMMGVYPLLINMWEDIPASGPVNVQYKSVELLFRSGVFQDLINTNLTARPLTGYFPGVDNGNDLRGTMSTKRSEVTISFSSPAIIGWPAHGYENGQTVTISSVNTLPSPFNQITDYYVVNATTDEFQVSLTSGGAAINTTNAGSGTFYASSWLFTRETNGSPVTLPDGTQFILDAAVEDRDRIINGFVGTNDVSEGLYANPAQLSARLIAAYSAALPYLTPLNKFIIANAVINRASFPAGSANYNYIIAANNDLEAWCAANAVPYWNGRRWMVTSALAALGLTPFEFTGTATITQASPAVVTVTGNGQPSNTQFKFTATTGALPAPLQLNTLYYTRSATFDTCQLSLTANGVSINTTTAGSGVHTAVFYGDQTDIDNDVCPRSFRGVPGDYDDIHWYPIGRLAYATGLYQFFQTLNWGPLLGLAA